MVIQWIFRLNRILYTVISIFIFFCTRLVYYIVSCSGILFIALLAYTCIVLYYILYCNYIVLYCIFIVFTLYLQFCYILIGISAQRTIKHTLYTKEKYQKFVTTSSTAMVYLWSVKKSVLGSIDLKNYYINKATVIVDKATRLTVLVADLISMLYSLNNTLTSIIHSKRLFVSRIINS